MTDKYDSFAELSHNEKPGRDYRIRVRDRGVPTLVIAPHGGGIEPGTSEIADAIAGDDFSFYAFEGIKPRGKGRNGDLHITSHRFDESTCVNLVEASTTTISIHGEKGDVRVVYLGGQDTRALEVLRAALRKRGFRVKTHHSPRLQGHYPGNICNRNRSRAGVQLELTNGLRRSFFQGLSRNARRHKTDRFREFVAAVRESFGEQPHHSDVPSRGRSSKRPSKTSPA